MREISSQGKLLAVHLPGMESLPEGSRFYCGDHDFIQLASHQYSPGKFFQPHQHHVEPRVAEKTQEVLIVTNGAMQADIYNYNKELVESFTLHAGDVLVLLDGGHGFQILKENTRFLEIKNGPYPGPEKDRFRLFE